MVKNGYFISDVNVAQVIENKAQSKIGLSENINGLKNQPVKNGAQVIENKDLPNFGLNENINGLKNQLVKNGAQVIENTTQRNFPFSDFFIEATY